MLCFRMLGAAGMKTLAGIKGHRSSYLPHIQKLLHLGRVLQVKDTVALAEGANGSVASLLANRGWGVVILPIGIARTAEERLLTGHRARIARA